MNYIFRVVLIAVCFMYAGSFTLFSQSTIDCSGAASLTLNGRCFSGTIAASSIENPSSTLCGTIPTTPNRDFWMKFVATTPTATISVTTGTASVSYNLAVVVYSSACSFGEVAGTTEIGCSNSVASGTVSQTEIVKLSAPSLVVGNTYYARIFSMIAYTPSAPPTVTICVTGKPPNDDPAGAIALPNPVPFGCSTILSNFIGASTSVCSGVSTPTCGSYVSGLSSDVWFTVVMPATGKVYVNTRDFSPVSVGAMGAGMELYSATGACSGMTLLDCSDGTPSGSGATAFPSSMPAIYFDNIALAGKTLYVRVWNKSSADPGNFLICATTGVNPCGNISSSNYFCEDAAAITTTGNPLDFATGSILSNGIDIPGNLGVSNAYCGLPSNNMWYTFVATTPTLSIPFTADASCDASGLTAQVFGVNTTPLGCCKTFTPVSTNAPSCSNAGGVFTFANTTASIKMLSLTIGNTYYLMLSTNEVGCTFSINGWSATGVLVVDYISFTGSNEGNSNLMSWITSTETSINTYNLEHSENGTTFTPVATVKAKGGYSYNNQYSAYDAAPFEDVTYYRIRQVDNNGVEKFTNTISVNSKNEYDNIYNIQPNPTNSNVGFEYQSTSQSFIELELLGYASNVVLAIRQSLEVGKNKLVLPMSHLADGVYILKVVSQKTGKATYHKIIKN